MRGKTVEELITVEEYIDKKLKNESDLDIALSLYVSIGTFEHWKKSKGIKNKDVNRFRFQKIKKMKDNGLSFYKISEKMNMHRKSLSNIYNQFINE